MFEPFGGFGCGRSFGWPRAFCGGGHNILNFEFCHCNTYPFFTGNDCLALAKTGTGASTLHTHTSRVRVASNSAWVEGMGTALRVWCAVPCLTQPNSKPLASFRFAMLPGPTSAACASGSSNVTRARLETILQSCFCSWAWIFLMYARSCARACVCVCVCLWGGVCCMGFVFKQARLWPSCSLPWKTACHFQKTGAMGSISTHPTASIPPFGVECQHGLL